MHFHEAHIILRSISVHKPSNIRVATGESVTLIGITLKWMLCNFGDKRKNHKILGFALVQLIFLPLFLSLSYFPAKSSFSHDFGLLQWSLPAFK